MYHVWGDEWFEENGDDLYKAQNFICAYVYKYSRCRLMTKEKYGTIRYEWIFPPGGGVYSRYQIVIPFISKDVSFEVEPFKMTTKYYLGSKGKCRVIPWRWFDSFIYRRWCKFGRYVTDIAVRKACKKYPNVKDEILADYDREYIT